MPFPRAPQPEERFPPPFEEEEVGGEREVEEVGGVEAEEKEEITLQEWHWIGTG